MGIGYIRKGSRRSSSGVADIVTSDGLAVLGDGGGGVADEDDASSHQPPPLRRSPPRKARANQLPNKTRNMLLIHPIAFDRRCCLWIGVTRPISTHNNLPFLLQIHHIIIVDGIVIIITILNIMAPGIMCIHKRGRKAALGAANIVTSVGLAVTVTVSDGDEGRTW